MPTDQKAASAVVTSAMRDIARGFQLVLGLALYLLGPVGILFGMPLIVTAFAPSKVKKVVAIVYFILVLAVAALMVWKRAQHAPQVQHDQQIRQETSLRLRNWSKNMPTLRNAHEYARKHGDCGS